MPMIAENPASVATGAADVPTENTAPAEGQAPAEDTATEQLVVLRLADEDYAVAISYVREIIRMQNITVVPQAPPFVEGIINIRGSVIPVIDLRKRFGMLHREESADTRIIVVDVHTYTVGLVVDAVTEVTTIPESAIEPVSNMAVASLSSDLRGIVNLPEKLIILIDLPALLNTIAGQDDDILRAA